LILLRTLQFFLLHLYHHLISARDLKEGDLFRVGFTDAVCSLNKISYEYGRVWVKINFYDGEENICNISGHDEVYKIIRDKYE
jgi:hypothetical protein